MLIAIGVYLLIHPLVWINAEKMAKGVMIVFLLHDPDIGFLSLQTKIKHVLHKIETSTEINSLHKLAAAQEKYCMLAAIFKFEVFFRI